jgi:hypothetical protein
MKSKVKFEGISVFGFRMFERLSHFAGYKCTAALKRRNHAAAFAMAYL